MTAPRDLDADELVLKSLHAAQAQVGQATLALNAYRADQAKAHLVAAQLELNAVGRALTWPGGLDR